MPTTASGSLTGAGKAGGQAGRRKVPTSPTSLAHPSALPSVPRIKLSLRPTIDLPPQPHASGSGSGSTSNSQMPKRKVGRPRKSDILYQVQPARKAASRTRNKYKEINPDAEDEGDSSDLTPAEDIDEGDDSDPDITPRKRPVGRPKSGEKNKGKGKAKEIIRKKAKTTGGAGGSKESNSPAGAMMGDGKVTVSGPAGRQRRRAMKIEDSGRRRARDAKFDITEEAFGGSVQPQGTFHIRSFLDSDTASSFGDDESDHDMSPALAALEGMIHESDDDETRGLPEAFAGQEIEDLAYGAVPPEVELEREALAGWFEEEDEEMFISHLSGSEVDQQSQSSAHDSANSDIDSSSSESETEDQVDEFGFRIPLSNTEVGETVTEDPPGLVLMENWDGKLVLYQTNPSTRTSSKTRNRSNSRGSRTAGSTVAPSVSDQLDAGDRDRDLHLMIDPEAVAAEYDEDATSSEEWSGESDEMDGDTTDSMDEEDMPMLDSPAMQELIDQQIRLASPSIADGLLGERLNEGIPAPEIIVTDTDVVMGGEGIATPALSLSTTSTTAGTPQLPPFSIPTSIAPTPQTPGAAIIPVMGTFLPTSTDPAQMAVIDGSGTSTMSPFTHRRRSRKNRSDSVSVSSGGRSIMSSNIDRKRKSNSAALMADPFGGPPILRTISKKARYTSIPGHPKYVQAQRIEEDDGEATSTEEEEEGGEFDLEDMLDPEILEQLAQTAAHGGGNGGDTGEQHMRHLIRFDRVPVSAYIRRNFGTGGGSREIGGSPIQVQQAGRGRSSPAIGRNGSGLPEVLGLLPEAEGQGDTLMGVQARMIVSPLVRPVGGGLGERHVDSLHI